MLAYPIGHQNYIFIEMSCGQKCDYQHYLSCLFYCSLILYFPREIPDDVGKKKQLALVHVLHVRVHVHVVMVQETLVNSDRTRSVPGKCPRALQ